MVDKSFVLDYLPPNSKGVEIGVWKGEFSKVIFNKLNPSTLYLCDPWLFFSEYPDRWYGGTLAQKQQDMDSIYNDVSNLFKNNSNIILIRDTSDNLVNYIDANSLDWTYIDGNHSYEYVLKDLEISYQLIKPGGYITGDDYDEGNDISKAVKEFINKYSDYIEGALIKERQFILKLNKL
jgi:hypothetical protein